MNKSVFRRWAGANVAAFFLAVSMPSDAAVISGSLAADMMKTDSGFASVADFLENPPTPPTKKRVYTDLRPQDTDLLIAAVIKLKNQGGGGGLGLTALDVVNPTSMADNVTVCASPKVSLPDCREKPVCSEECETYDAASNLCVPKKIAFGLTFASADGACVVACLEGYVRSGGACVNPASLEDAGKVFPAGTVVASPADTLPGFVKCNGTAVPESCPTLKSRIGATLPNYQGAFLRGAGSQTFTWTAADGEDAGTKATGSRPTSTTYAGPAVGKKQGDTIRNIGAGPFYIDNPIRDSLWGALSSGGEWNQWGVGKSDGDNPYVQFNSNRVVPTAGEARPFNIGVNWFIKCH